MFCQKAYNEGWDSRIKGHTSLGLKANPYEEPDAKYYSWEEGYLDAAEQLNGIQIEDIFRY